MAGGTGISWVAYDSDANVGMSPKYESSSIKRYLNATFNC